MLDQFDKFNRRVGGILEWVGVVGLLLIMVITCVDVVGAKVFQWRLFGALDMVMLSQAVAIAFGLGITLIVGRHIQVEFIFSRLPGRVQAFIDIINHLLSLTLFGLIIWQLCLLGYSFKLSGEYSATARIPYYPFAYGIAFACATVWLILFQRLLKSIERMVRK